MYFRDDAFELKGIETTLDIYFEALLDVYEKYRFRIWLHPVVPVLDVTRPVVTKFNRALKSRMARQKWPFIFLDFVDG